MSRELQGNKITQGKVSGELLVSKNPISFLGGVDPETGKIIDPKNNSEGKSVSNKILAFPYGKGSTVGSYILYQLKNNDKAPKGLINEKAETIVAVGAIISDIPMIDGIDVNSLQNGERVTLNADNGIIIFEEE